GGGSASSRYAALSGSSYVSATSFEPPSSFVLNPSEPVIEPCAWSAPVLRSASQRRPGRGMALKIVGELRDVSSPRASGEKRRRSAPKSSAGWRLAPAGLPSNGMRFAPEGGRPDPGS